MNEKEKQQLQQVLRVLPVLPAEKAAEKVAEKVFGSLSQQFSVQQPDDGDAAEQSARWASLFAAAEKFRAPAAVWLVVVSVVHRRRKLWAVPAGLSAAPAWELVASEPLSFFASP